ncbi:MAG TPA: GDYXXLXY domain-containing protein [Vicinamibacterales bacterium]|jgi:uncharacterized membrane-anchored protein
MTTSARVIALVILSVAQLGAAAWSIARYESTLRSGALYRIRIEPVDPADAFHGRYVAVRPSITVLADDKSDLARDLQRIQSGERGYVVLAADADGFARVSDVVFTPPAQGDYLEVAYVWDQWTRETQPGETARHVGYNVSFSFDRYYMNEGAAPIAEQRYAEASRRNSTAKAWLAVRVKGGAGVIEGLLIDGDPIK